MDYFNEMTFTKRPVTLYYYLLVLTYLSSVF